MRCLDTHTHVLPPRSLFLMCLATTATGTITNERTNERTCVCVCCQWESSSSTSKSTDLVILNVCPSPHLTHKSPLSLSFFFFGHTTICCRISILLDIYFIVFFVSRTTPDSIYIFIYTYIYYNDNTNNDEKS